MADWETLRSRYLVCLESNDLRAGSAFAEDLVSEGNPLSQVIDEVLRPAQVDVGRRWQANEVTVADEHAASAITEAALMAGASASSPARAIRPGVVVLAGAEGDWHTVPLRMVSAGLTEAGFECVFLGPSVPAAHLQAYLDRLRPVALAVSCSVAVNLDGVRSCADAAHAASVPLIVGGRALGVDNSRARTAGADAWGAGPLDAAAVLNGWIDHPPTTFATPSVADDVQVPAQAELSLVEDASIALLRGQIAALSDYDDPRWLRTREDIDYIVRFAAAALRFRDRSIFTEFSDWLSAVLAARDVPRTVLVRSYQAIAASLPDRHAAIRELIAGVAARVGAPDQGPGSSQCSGGR